MTYEITRSIPPPRPPGHSSKYPFRKLEIGDSFLVPRLRADPYSGATPDAVYGATYRAAKKLGYKFTVKTTSKGIRIWRIA